MYVGNRLQILFKELFIFKVYFEKIFEFFLGKLEVVCTLYKALELG